ncbi:MAG TPA: hypothetical protein VMP42_05570 [Actinomycetota bacterium]|nr:hypothetical protein [Actinomycetota bacterium]
MSFSSWTSTILRSSRVRSFRVVFCLSRMAFSSSFSMVAARRGSKSSEHTTSTTSSMRRSSRSQALHFWHCHSTSTFPLLRVRWVALIRYPQQKTWPFSGRPWDSAPRGRRRQSRSGVLRIRHARSQSSLGIRASWAGRSDHTHSERGFGRFPPVFLCLRFQTW